jgi:hypothetical protein
VQFQSSHFSWKCMIALSILVAASVLMISYSQGLSSCDNTAVSCFVVRLSYIMTGIPANNVPIKNNRIVVQILMQSAHPYGSHVCSMVYRCKAMFRQLVLITLVRYHVGILMCSDSKCY